MPPRLPLALPRAPALHIRTYAAYTPPPPPTTRVAPTKPPSHRAAETRKTQLHRSYLSLLRSTPLMLLFQHNNLRAVEWTALRRELATALNKLTPKDSTEVDAIAEGIRVSILRGGVFNAAVRVAEFYDPTGAAATEAGTSIEAYRKTIYRKDHPLSTLITGPVGVVTFPAVSPVHLKTVMELMFPAGRAPKGLDPLALSGLHKLVLLAARVDGHVAAGGNGEVMAGDKVRWVGALPGFEGLQAQVVAILQTVGGGDLVRTLEAAPISVVRTLDGHRKVLSGELEEGAEVKAEEAKAE